MQPGHATEAGTQRYIARFEGRVAPGHFRHEQGLWISSLGIGTYLGEPDASTDEAYRQAVRRSVEAGINVIDSAINYRFQRSERSIGAALTELFAAGYSREEIIVSTKGGFLTPDGDHPGDPAAYFEEHYIRPGILRVEEIAGGMHCMAPRYLLDQLDRSRRNLGLECIDIYYVHNPETQLPIIGRQKFLERLRAAFAASEEAVAQGKIRMYGTATWDGYRRPERSRDYLSLEEIVDVARGVAGEQHHFRVVQLPYNLAMPEAFLLANQPLAGKSRTMLDAARELGITVMASASILQGQVSRNLPDFVRAALNGLETDAQRALQFVRSTPGITTALVGMSNPHHVAENLVLVERPPTGRERLMKLFSSG